MQKNNKRGKFLFLYIVFGLAFLILIFRYFQVQVLLKDESFQKLLEKFPKERTLLLPGWRGAIYTSDGVPMAITIPTHLYYVIGSRLSDSAKELAAEVYGPLFPMGKEKFLEEIKRAQGYRVLYESENATLYKEFKQTRRRLWREELKLSKKVFGHPVADRDKILKYCSEHRFKDLYSQKLCDLREVLDWLGVENANRRYYPQGKFLSNTVGFVNKLNRGVADLELMEDKYLYRGPIRITYIFGSSKYRVIPQPVLGDVRKILTSDVYLTIDYTVQAILERVKLQIVKRWHPQKVVIALMDIHTGKLLGLTTYPDFDPNNVTSLNGTANPFFDDTFEMGSVIKPFFIGLALYTKKVHPGEKIKIGQGVRVGNHIVRDAERLPPYLTVEQVLIHSSNVGTVRIAKRLSYLDEKALVNLLGWNRRISRFPGSSAGLVPDLTLPANRQYIAFGQGLALTPAHLLSSYAALITGYAPVPQLVEKIVQEDGKVVYTFKPKYINKTPLFDNSTRNWIKNTLQGVVTEGTGKEAFPYYYQVGGKTGTAQVYDKKLHRYSSWKYATSFIGFFPYPNPKYVLLVMVYIPKAPRHYLLYGGTVAAPYWREIVNEVSSYLQIKPSPDVEWLKRKTHGAVGG